MDWKNYNKKLNQQIIMEFWITEFELYFQKTLSWSFFVGLIFFPPKHVCQKIV